MRRYLKKFRLRYDIIINRSRFYRFYRRHCFVQISDSFPPVSILDRWTRHANPPTLTKSVSLKRAKDLLLRLDLKMGEVKSERVFFCLTLRARAKEFFLSIEAHFIHEWRALSSMAIFIVSVRSNKWKSFNVKLKLLKMNHMFFLPSLMTAMKHH